MKSATPDFSWTAVSKNQLQTLEKRSLRFTLCAMIDDKSWKDSSWTLQDSTGSATSASLAKDTPSETPIPIKEGNYVATVTYSDVRSSTPIKLAREYRVGRKIKFQLSGN